MLSRFDASVGLSDPYASVLGPGSGGCWPEFRRKYDSYSACPAHRLIKLDSRAEYAGGP